MNPIKKLRLYLAYRKAVRMADRAHAMDGERYYVYYSLDNKLIILNRKMFKKLKLKRYIEQSSTIRCLERDCFYCTPYRNGSGQLPATYIKAKRFWYYQVMGNARPPKSKL